MFGFKLIPARADSNSGLLPSSGHDPRTLLTSTRRWAWRPRSSVSNTVLKYGSMMPDVPLLKYNDGRPADHVPWRYAHLRRSA
jgi:hypothetical protein